MQLDPSKFKGSFTRESYTKEGKPGPKSGSGHKVRSKSYVNIPENVSNQNVVPAFADMQQMNASIDICNEKNLMEENQTLKNQIAELQDVIVSMCVLNQRQQSVKSFDDIKKQVKRRRKPALNKFIESRESNAPIP